MSTTPLSLRHSLEMTASNVSTVQLNGIIDETWARALAVANLMQSERELVVLCEVAAAVVGTSSAGFVICDAAIDTSAHGPRAAIEDVVRAVPETFAAEEPNGRLLRSALLSAMAPSGSRSAGPKRT